MSGRRIAGRCKAVQIAGSQSAEAAVAESRIRLVVVDAVQLDIKLFQEFLNVLRQIQIIKAGL